MKTPAEIKADYENKLAINQVLNGKVQESTINSILPNFKSYLDWVGLRLISVGIPGPAIWIFFKDKGVYILTGNYNLGPLKFWRQV